MNKIKILGISPYEGIDIYMKQVAGQSEDISLTSYIGDLEKGLEIASKYNMNDFDIIISRGGTAELVKNFSKIPVVDIPISLNDIFRSMKLAENYTQAYALVGFPSITNNAHFLSTMLQSDIKIITIHSEKEARETLLELKNSGYQMILCDMVTNTIAKEYGLSSILITSGIDSVENAFAQAINIYRNNYLQNQQYHLVKATLDNFNQQAFVFDENANLIFSSDSTTGKSHLITTMKYKINDILENKEERIYKRYDGKLYILDAIKKDFNNNLYTFFYVTVQNKPSNTSKHGFKYLSKFDSDDEFFNNFYAICHSKSETGISIDEFSSTDYPIMVLGEAGSGIEQIVHLIHTKSTYKHNSLVVIDCNEVLTSKAWTYLMEHSNSPFNDIDVSIYIKNIDSLDNVQFPQLVKILTHINSLKKCKLIFSARYNELNTIPSRYKEISNTLSCLTIAIPPLREHPYDIPNLFSLYISTLNITNGKEIIGIDPDGLEILKNYEWPLNYSQFIRIINELVLLTNTPYITKKSVENIIKKEDKLSIPTTSQLNLNRSLEEINYDIIKMKLEENEGNQSLTARELGISRSTLWRILQKYKD